LRDVHVQGFSCFAALPLPDVDGAPEELSYALDELKLDGVVLFSNANGVARFKPVLAELERCGAVVFAHPTASPDPSAHQLGLPDSLIDFTADTTRAVAQMHFSNRFARTPSVKHIFSHAGGTVPHLAGRWAIVDEMNVIAGGEERGTAADILRRLYWDTALSYREPVLRMSRESRRTGLSLVRIGLSLPPGELRRGARADRRTYSGRANSCDERERHQAFSAIWSLRIVRSVPPCARNPPLRQSFRNSQ
jgi:6-methylsalicylate decarboxylase